MSFRLHLDLLLLLLLFTIAMTSAQLESENSSTTTTTLVLGATGATGKWVVKQLLDEGHDVRVVVRSKERMTTALEEISHDEDRKALAARDEHLTITEASLLDLSDGDLQRHVEGCDVVVSCLGHKMDFGGLWGRKGRRLVTDAVKRVTKAIGAVGGAAGKTKFILMGSDGVANPDGRDDERTAGERLALFLMRCLLPPVADNEEAAAYVHNSLGTGGGGVEWSVVRPTDLIDGPPTGKYQLFDKPRGGLFGAGVATRSHVAHVMVRMIVDPVMWERYRFKMPVLHDIVLDDPETEL